jgi:hypothetical protein
MRRQALGSVRSSSPLRNSIITRRTATSAQNGERTLQPLVTSGFGEEGILAFRGGVEDVGQLWARLGRSD